VAQIVRKKLFGDHDPYKDLELMPFNGHGFVSNHPCFKEFLSPHFNPKLIVEVGSWMGGSARAMTSVVLDYAQDFEVVCIDTWLGSEEHWVGDQHYPGNRLNLVNGRPTLYQQFLSNNVHKGLDPYITPFPIDSQNGFVAFTKLGLYPDAVYIDAGHDYRSVKNDLSNWASILKKGGVLIGDDWHHPPIKQAVGELFGKVYDRREKFVWIK
jgi:hypothetical protein